MLVNKFAFLIKLKVERSLPSHDSVACYLLMLYINLFVSLAHTETVALDHISDEHVMPILENCYYYVLKTSSYIITDNIITLTISIPTHCSFNGTSVVVLMETLRDCIKVHSIRISMCSTISSYLL